jgi:hypothetical protein
MRNLSVALLILCLLSAWTGATAAEAQTIRCSDYGAITSCNGSNGFSMHCYDYGFSTSCNSSGGYSSGYMYTPSYTPSYMSPSTWQNYYQTEYSCGWQGCPFRW